ILEFANFSRSIIESASFFNADLYRANFNEAVLCNVNFSEADVRSASFWGVTFPENLVPNLTGTAWWTASGWSMDQVNQFSLLYTKEKFKDSRRFRDELKRLRGAVERTSSGLQKAETLNAKAWDLATYGLDLADASASALEAIRIVQMLKMDQNESIRKEAVKKEAAYKDTLAYILMQQEDNDNFGKAAKLLEESLTISEEGETIFRYAI